MPAGSRRAGREGCGGGAGSTPRLHEFAGAREISRRVDLHSEPAGIDEADRDPHSRLERTKLLEAFSLLEHAPRQPDKAIKRRPAIGVEPDMLVVLPRPPRDDRLAEVEGTRRPTRIGKPNSHLVNARVIECLWVHDYRC